MDYVCVSMSVSGCCGEGGVEAAATQHRRQCQCSGSVLAYTRTRQGRARQDGTGSGWPRKLLFTGTFLTFLSTYLKRLSHMLLGVSQAILWALWHIYQASPWMNYINLRLEYSWRINDSRGNHLLQKTLVLCYESFRIQFDVPNDSFIMLLHHELKKQPLKT